MFVCKLETKDCSVLKVKDVVNITLLDIGMIKLYSINALNVFITYLSAYKYLFLYLDAVSENMFWYDSGKQTVEVMSLRTGYRIILMANATNVYDILFVSDHGLVIYNCVHYI